jgi:hypothetical protein
MVISFNNIIKQDHLLIKNTVDFFKIPIDMGRNATAFTGYLIILSFIINWLANLPNNTI